MSKKQKLINAIVADLQEGGPIHQAMKVFFGLAPLANNDMDMLHDLKEVKEAFDKHDAGTFDVVPVFHFGVKVGDDSLMLWEQRPEYYDPHHNRWITIQDHDIKRVEEHGYKTRRVFVEIPKQEMGKPTIL